MEELLNKLIEKGWKPMWKKMTKCHRERCRLNSEFWEYWVFNHIWENWQSIDRQFCLKIREIVSKNSWLWQFVCENGMINVWWYVNGWCYHNDYDEYDEWDWEYYDEELKRFYDKNYEYRLIESALKDEDELEQFLLSNIVIKDE